MGKSAKQPDPLRPKASRVEKFRTQSSKRELPSWFYRVNVVRYKEDTLDHRSDYDEDLSELDEDAKLTDDDDDSRDD